VLTWQVAAHGPLRALDERTGDAVAASAFPSPLAQFLADLGNMPVALPVLAAAIGYAAWRGRRAHRARWWLPPLAAALTMAAVPALVVPLKDWIARTGPPAMGHGPHDGFFPSGHAATAAVAYGAAAVLLVRHHPGLRRVVTAFVLLLQPAVGLGLVRRGYHWPLDVLASWCLSVLLLTALASITSPAGLPSWLPQRARRARERADR
jgi:undecaprenyl-diphosphatase